MLEGKISTRVWQYTTLFHSSCRVSEGQSEVSMASLDRNYGLNSLLSNSIWMEYGTLIMQKKSTIYLEWELHIDKKRKTDSLKNLLFIQGVFNLFQFNHLQKITGIFSETTKSKMTIYHKIFQLWKFHRVLYIVKASQQQRWTESLLLM